MYFYQTRQFRLGHRPAEMLPTSKVNFLIYEFSVAKVIPNEDKTIYLDRFSVITLRRNEFTTLIALRSYTYFYCSVVAL